MPTKEALEKLKAAKERMDAADAAHRAYIEDPGRKHTKEESEAMKNLGDKVSQAIAEYWKAFDDARGS